MRNDIRHKLRQAAMEVAFTSGSKQLPFLEAYLNHAVRMPGRVLQNLLIGMAAVAGGGLSLLAALALVIAQQFVAAIAVFVGYPVLCAIAGWGLAKLRGPRNARDRRDVEVRHAAEALRPLLTRRRMNRSVGTATTTLLEESARYWQRATSALNGPFWTNESLPAHWQEVRMQALQASDDAMGDLILLAEQNMKPVVTKSDWQDVVGNVVGGLLGVPEREDDEPLPPMFDTAREISNKLKLLAAQVEKATQEVILEQPQGDTIRSAASLDACLSELQSIQQAESELRQNQGG